MPDPTKVHVVNHGQIRALAFFYQPPIPCHLREDGRDVPGGKRYRCWGRELLLSYHPVNRLEDAIPMTTREVSRNRIHATTVDERI
ncbi:hypothetical protein ACVJBD_000564 [Rhizobium mongolense]